MHIWLLIILKHNQFGLISHSYCGDWQLLNVKTYLFCFVAGFLLDLILLDLLLPAPVWRIGGWLISFAVVEVGYGGLILRFQTWFECAGVFKGCISWWGWGGGRACSRGSRFGFAISTDRTIQPFIMDKWITLHIIHCILILACITSSLHCARGNTTV